nr:tetratricopeptide repeat protein [uncultured Holophaga sp.]
MLELLYLFTRDSGLEALTRPPAAEVTRIRPEELLFREARTLRHQQRWFEAAALYRRFLVDHPGSPLAPRARFWLAATLEQDQRWDEAARAYSDFLDRHGSHPTLAREATLNRIRCWGIRQGQSPEATQGLLRSLQDPRTEIQVAAALQLAKTGDRRAIPALQAGLRLPDYADAATLQLIALGARPAPTSGPTQGRFLVMRIHEKDSQEDVTIRLSLSLARALGNYLSNAQLQQLKNRGWDLDRILSEARELPKGSPLLTVEDGESRISVVVE